MSKQTDTAFRKGYEAARQKLTVEACPYVVTRRAWSLRSYRLAWMSGFNKYIQDVRYGTVTAPLASTKDATFVIRGWGKLSSIYDETET